MPTVCGQSRWQAQWLRQRHVTEVQDGRCSKGQAVVHGEKQVTRFSVRDFPSFFSFFYKSCQWPEERLWLDAWHRKYTSTHTQRRRNKQKQRRVITVWRAVSLCLCLFVFACLCSIQLWSSNLLHPKLSLNIQKLSPSLKVKRTHTHTHTHTHTKTPILFKHTHQTHTHTEVHVWV